MNSKQPILTAVIILMLSHLIYAQSYLRVQIGGGTSSNYLTTGILSNWGDEWTIGGGLSHSLNSQIELAINVSYSRYPYRGGNFQFGVVPAVYLGWYARISGKPTSVTEVSISTRFSSSPSFIKPFLSLTTGLYQIHIGEIIISSWHERSPENVSYNTYNGSGKSITKVFAALGAGISMAVNSYIGFVIEGRYAQAINSKEIFLPLLAAVQIEL